MIDGIAITVDKVSKSFILPHEKVDSVKGLLTSARKRSKTKDVQTVLKGVEFEVKKGEFFGIVGRNGSGKSTLLKILASIYQPTKGKVHTAGKVVPFIELGVGFNPELTGRENVYLNGAMLGFSEKEVDAMYADIVAFAELERFMDQKLKNYSSGMQVRLAFSVATQARADVLIVDEVLAVGDADFQRKCYEYFKGIKNDRNVTVVFVTHDMQAVRDYCDRAILIKDGVVADRGDVEHVADSYLQMFQENTVSSDDEQRWGSGDVIMEEVKVVVEKDVITIRAKLLAHKDANDFRFGYLFRDTENHEVLGGNSVNAHKGAVRRFTLKEEERMELEFSMLNILGNGSYWFDATVMGNDEIIYDKWEKMTQVTVFKSLVYYPVVAPAKLEINNVKQS